MPLSIDDALNWRQIATWLRINLGKIVLTGTLCAFLALTVMQFRSKTYRSSVTLLVSPPTFKETGKVPVSSDQEGIAEMMPKALPVESYKAIALSDSVLNDVLNKAGLDVDTQALRGQMQVELVQMGSRGSQGIMYTQTLIFYANAESPELAAKLAQVWAEVFKGTVDNVIELGVGETYTLLESLHNQTKSDLEKASIALADHSKMWNLDLIQAQLEEKQALYTEFESELKRIKVEVVSSESKVRTLTNELSKESPKNIYFRAPSDDAYWIGSLSNEGQPKLEPDTGLRTEEPNENYVLIREKVVASLEEFEGLKAKQTAIESELEKLRNEIDMLAETRFDKTVERDELTRESKSLTDSYEVVRSQFEKGRMANSTRASDIMVVGNAVPPKSPIGPSLAMIAIVATLLGMFLAASFLAARDLTKSVESRENEPENQAS